MIFLMFAFTLLGLLGIVHPRFFELLDGALKAPNSFFLLLGGEVRSKTDGVGVVFVGVYWSLGVFFGRFLGWF